MNCLFCNESNNLNTIEIDGIQVALCPDHEDSSIKSIKAALAEKDDELKKLEEMAAKMGYKLQPSTSGLVIPQAQDPKPEPQYEPPQPQLEPIKEEPIEFEKDEDLEDKGLVRQIIRKKPKSSREGGMAPAITNDEMSDSQKLEKMRATQKDLQTFKTKWGAHVTIPAQSTGPAGTTEIKIVDTGGDSELQRRAKAREARDRGEAPPEGIMYEQD